ncbi:MAG: potassium transporter TrkG, partial [Candidatus Cloacimonadota bacterium]|nr:potassium transporter TrkG [Candidatus Cloacimonadota bacterium]
MKKRFNSLSVILNYLGSLFIILSGLLLLPIIVAYIFNDPIVSHKGFLISSLLSISTGLIMKKVFNKGKLNTLQATIICSLGWIFISAIGAIPFVLIIDSSYLNAYFETMSGFTTTGITMYSALDLMPRSIIFWRSIIQWIGGLGILTFFLAIISQSSGGHNLFGAESHKIQVKRPVPGMKNTIKILWIIYSIFTIFIFLNLLLTGISIFDALNHSLTTISTGGFSPYDASISHYKNIGHPHYIWIEYIIILGMFLGGTNFLIHYRILFMKQFNAIYDSIEMRYWFGFIALFSGIIMLEVILKSFSISFSIRNFDFW